MAPTSTSSSTTSLSTSLSKSPSRTSAPPASTKLPISHSSYNPFSISPGISHTAVYGPTQSPVNYGGNSGIGSTSGGISWQAGIVVVAVLMFGLAVASIAQGRRRRAASSLALARRSQAYGDANNVRDANLASRIWGNSATRGGRTTIRPLPGESAISAHNQCAPETELEQLPAYVEPPPYKGTPDEDSSVSARQSSATQSDIHSPER